VGRVLSILLLSGRCRTAASSRRTSAGTQTNEAVNQQVQSGTSDWLIEARGANDILPADPGEMSKHVARPNLTEHEPGVAFIADRTVGLKGKSDVAQDC